MPIETMSIEEKVGQLFILGFHGTELHGEVLNLISNYRIGGLLLQHNNMHHPKQVHRFISRAQRYANNHFPLFLATYQTGGNDNSILQGVTQSPTQSELIQVNNRLYTKQIAEHVASELHEMGINMNFVPELYAEHQRSTKLNNEDLVGKHGIATIQGYQKHHVLTIASSFPTMNDIQLDPSILMPFTKAINAGVDAITLLEPTKAIIQLLREELNFNGIVISTCQKEANWQQFALNVLQAGVDMIIMPSSYKAQIHTINQVTEALHKQIVNEEQLTASVKRITHAKTKRKVGQMKTFNSHLFQTDRAIALAEKLNKQ